MADIPDPKQRILRTAADLFARRGYGVVGVREIAREADVNISMISYYFNGKMGILKTIIEQFFDDYLEVIRSVYNPTLPPEALLKQLVQHIIAFLRANRDEALVMFSQLPIDEPEITELKISRVRKLVTSMQGFLRQLGVDPETRRLHVAIIGPAFIGTLFSTFLLAPIAKGVFKVEYDDAFYEHYVDVITAYVLGGINRVQNLINESED